jgi:flagellar motor switch protein FliN/FliY
MSQLVREWLPWGTVDRGPVTRAIQEAVQTWSGAWFASRPIRVSHVSATSGEVFRDDNGEVWRAYAADVAVKCPRAASNRLICAALDIRPEQLAATEADRRVLAGFERSLLTDLCVRLEEAAGLARQLRSEPVEVAEPYQGLGGAEVLLSDDQGRLPLAIAVPLSSLASLCKAGLPPPRPATEGLAELMAVLGEVRVSVEAKLGSVKIALSEMESLSCGDVIALPAKLDDPAELHLAGGGRVIGRGSLVEADDHRAISIEC